MRKPMALVSIAIKRKDGIRTIPVNFHCSWLVNLSNNNSRYSSLVTWALNYLRLTQVNAACKKLSHIYILNAKIQLNNSNSRFNEQKQEFEVLVCVTVADIRRFKQTTSCLYEIEASSYMYSN